MDSLGVSQQVSVGVADVGLPVHVIDQTLDSGEDVSLPSVPVNSGTLKSDPFDIFCVVLILGEKVCS